MSIWYISKYFAPETDDSCGGRGWLLMEELAKREFSPIVITSDSNRLIEPPKLTSRSHTHEHKGVKLVWLKTYQYRNAKSARRILSWLHFEWNLLRLNKNNLAKPDVIIASSLSLLSILSGLWLKRRYKCKLVFEVRDIWPLTLTEEGGFSRKNPFVMFLAWVEKLAYRKSDVIIGTMPNLKEHVASVSKTNVPVHCIPMGVPSSSYLTQEPLKPDFKDKYFAKDTFKVMHAGTIGITNALGTFLKTAEALQSDPRFEFFLVGDGPLKKEYQEKYSHLSNLIFVPKVNKKQVQSVLACSDIVYFSVFPSKVWDYGQSLNKVVDYMHSGKPIIASYSGYPSMINEAGCGSFVPSNDVDVLINELCRYAEMPREDLVSIGQKGKTWIEKNRSYQQLASDLANILR